MTARQETRLLWIDGQRGHRVEMGDHRVRHATRVAIEVANLSVVVSGDDHRLRRMADHAINTIVGIVRCWTVVDHFSHHLARLGVVDQRFEGIVGHNELIGVLHQPIDGDGNTLV